MVSIDEIKSKLLNIAESEGYKGEVIDVISSLLSYSLYNEYISNLNLYNELNLNTAITENSKILRAAEQMYSVFRGSLPTVEFNFIPNIKLDYDRLDLVNAFNKCYIYACENTQIHIGKIDINKQEEAQSIKCYITNTPMKSANTEIISKENGNIYFIDVKDKDGKLAKNISEHILVKDVDPDTGNERILKVTRSFHEHCSSYIDEDYEDNVFALTMPDYGVRLFKFGYRDESNSMTKVGFWPSGHRIEISYLEYSDDVKYNESEFERYKINGAEKPADDSVKPYYTIKNGAYRDTVESIPYLANTSINIRSVISSRTDISELFKEHFIDEVKNAELKELSMTNGKKKIKIIYTIRPEKEEKNNEYSISSDKILDFKTRYGTYLTQSGDVDLVAEKAETINVNLVLYVKSNTKIDQKITDILAKYEGKIETWKKEEELLYNETKILSMISKLDEIEYISSSTFSPATKEIEKYKNENTFVQYKFNLIINYLN